MNTAAIKKTEIVRELSRVPEHKLDSVRMYIDAILAESKRLAKSNRSLKGIWSNRGFEKIVDLEAELREARKQTSDVILAKQF
ncbi:MAG: hypothetical protein ACREOO_15600 [bacterium]